MLVLISITVSTSSSHIIVATSGEYGYRISEGNSSHRIENSETGEQTACLEAWIASWRLIRCCLLRNVTVVTYNRSRDICKKAPNMFADGGCEAAARHVYHHLYDLH